MSRRSSRPVRSRAGRAAGALTVVAVAAFGPPGPGLLSGAGVHAVGTVTQSVAAIAPAAVEVPGVAAAAPATALPGLATVGGVGTVTGTVTGSAVIGTPTLPTTPAIATATVVPPSAPTGSGIPGTVLAAYKTAEAALAASAPGCHVSWALIAGIGRVESGNASGGRVDEAGTTRGRILGPRLDGNGTAVINDTDGGALDGDTVFDRAVGPMQFIPGTWKSYAQDGNRDGVASPHNVFDAALSAGTYLCAGGGDLSQPAAQRAALLRYNRSDAYGALVLRWAAAYAGGVAVLPNEQGEVPTTTPTPPAQVPAPAAGTIDPATSAALAAAKPVVTGTVASESSADSDRSTTTTTTTTTRASTTSAPPTTPTTPTTTPPTTTPSPPASTTTPKTTTTPKPPATTSKTTATPPTTTSPVRTTTSSSPPTSTSAPKPDPGTKDTTTVTKTTSAAAKTSTTTTAPKTTSSKATSSKATSSRTTATSAAEAGTSGDSGSDGG